MRSARILTMGVLLACGSLTACGSSGPKAATSTTSSAGSSATTASKGGGGIELTAQDFAFSPTTLEASAGSATVTVDNQGAIEHNLTIEGLGVDQDLTAGKATKVTFDAKPGTYQYYCGYHPSKMKGTITVQ